MDEIFLSGTIFFIRSMFQRDCDLIVFHFKNPYLNNFFRHLIYCFLGQSVFMKLYSVAGILFLLIYLTLPVFAEISVNSVYYEGEKITIRGMTNYNTDNSILIEIWPASFGPKSKYEPSMTGGGSAVVPVLKGNYSDYVWYGSFDSAGWIPDEYMVRAEVIGKGYVETNLFELALEKEVPLVTTEPTMVPVITTIQTTNISQETQMEQEKRDIIGSTQGTPVPTQKSPLDISGVVLSLFFCFAGVFILRVRQ